MRTKMIAIAIAIATLCSNGVKTTAACRVNRVVKSTDEPLVIVPFAVPVGVPVTPFAPYFYSYLPGQQSVPSVPASSASTAPESASPVVAAKVDRAQIESIVATRCASCHGGASPKAGLSLEHLDTLNADDRLRSIRAVLSGQMPKGSRPSADEVRLIVNELAQSSLMQPKTAPAATSAALGNPNALATPAAQ